MHMSIKEWIDNQFKLLKIDDVLDQIDFQLFYDAQNNYENGF